MPWNNTIFGKKEIDKETKLIIRKIARKTKLDRICCEKTSVYLKINKRWLNWFRHVSRMETTRIVINTGNERENR